MFALGGGNGEAGSERHKSTTQRCGVNGEDGRNVKKGAAAHRFQSYAAGPLGSRIERDLDRCTYENASCLLACVLDQSCADFLESTQAYDRAEYVNLDEGAASPGSAWVGMLSLSRRDVCVRQDCLQGSPCQPKRTKNP